MIRTLLLIGLTVLLVGCGPDIRTIWIDHKDGSRTEIRCKTAKDLRECTHADVQLIGLPSYHAE